MYCLLIAAKIQKKSIHKKLKYKIEKRKEGKNEV